MIRIDLGSDEFKKSGGGGGLSGLLGKLSFRKKADAGEGGGGRLSAGSFERPRRSFAAAIGNLGSTVILILAVVGSYLPHMFFLQYKDYVVAQHEARKKELEEKVALIGREISKLQPFQKELESYEQQKKLVKDRLETIRTLLAARGTPVNVLDAIGQSLPQRAWINSLEIDAKQARPVVNLSGQALSNDDISDYVDKLSESVYLQDVVLEGVNTTKGLGTSADVKNFQLQVVPKGMRSFASQSSPAKPAATPPPVASKPPPAGSPKKPSKAGGLE